MASLGEIPGRALKSLPLQRNSFVRRQLLLTGAVPGKLNMALPGRIPWAGGFPKFPDLIFLRARSLFSAQILFPCCLDHADGNIAWLRDFIPLIHQAG